MHCRDLQQTPDTLLDPLHTMFDCVCLVQSSIRVVAHVVTRLHVGHDCGSHTPNMLWVIVQTDVLTNVTYTGPLQVLAACAVRSVPQCNAAALKNMMWALGTASFHHEQLLKAIEAQLLSQSPHLG